jgi:hypothetical protein
MRKLLLAALLILISAFPGNSQRSGHYWSTIPCSIENKSDGDFLISTESKIWKAAVNPGLEVYEGYSQGGEFRIRMTKSAVSWLFRDSSGYIGTVPIFDMSLMWDRSADVCYVMSFSARRTFYHVETRYKPAPPQPPVTHSLSDSSTTRIVFLSTGIPYLYTDSTDIDTGTFVKIPLISYRLFLNKEENERRRQLIVGEVAKAMHGNVTKGDTIFRLVTFTVDSSDILPQAPIRSLLETFKNGLFSGSLHANKNKIPGPAQWMTKRQLDDKFVSWDSTNAVEDPNNPGIFILAPIKYEGQCKSLLIYERWVPMQLQVNGAYGYPPQPWKSFRRETISYGLKLTNDKIIWIDVKEAELYLPQENFSMIAYEELFRAERFRTMKITQLY